MGMMNPGKKATMLVANGLEGEEIFVEKLKKDLVKYPFLEFEIRNEEEYTSYDVIIRNLKNNRFITVEVERSKEEEWERSSTYDMLDKKWPFGLSIPSRKIFLSKEKENGKYQIYKDQNDKPVFKKINKNAKFTITNNSPYNLYIRFSKNCTHFFATTFRRIRVMYSNNQLVLQEDVKNTEDSISNTNNFCHIPKSVITSESNKKTNKLVVVDDFEYLYSAILKKLCI